MSERYINNLSGDLSICFSEHITGHPSCLSSQMRKAINKTTKQQDNKTTKPLNNSHSHYNINYSWIYNKIFLNS